MYEHEFDAHVWRRWVTIWEKALAVADRLYRDDPALFQLFLDIEAPGR